MYYISQNEIHLTLLQQKYISAIRSFLILHYSYLICPNWVLIKNIFVTVNISAIYRRNKYAVNILEKIDQKLFI